MTEQTKLKVMSAGAVKDGVAQLAAEFERASGHSVHVFAAVGAQEAARPAGALVDHLTTPAAKATFAASGID